METLQSLIESDQPVKDVVSKILPKLDKLPEYTGRIPLELCINEVSPNSWSGWAVYGNERMGYVGGAYGLPQGNQPPVNSTLRAEGPLEVEERENEGRN